MKYKKFIIERYKGINEPIEIDLSSSLIPLIGTNESGKTTALEAVFSFDFRNDDINDGFHLADTENLYETTNSPAIIKAEISFTKKALSEIFTKLIEDGENKKYDDDRKFLQQNKSSFRRISEFGTNLIISRNIKDELYQIENRELEREYSDYLSTELIRKLPYILYFDDFKDNFEGIVQIPSTKEKSSSRWIPILETLFNKTNPDYSIYNLRSQNVHITDSVIRDVQGYLNEKITKHWSNFSLEKGKPLKIELKYIDEGTLDFKVVEKIERDGLVKEKFFGIKGRSKGFFWYFNFIMKLEFNPKIRDISDKDTIYLLDEPGSFLHSTAQSKLSHRLVELSKNNKVIFCTHSPYLLNPEHISLKNIKVASKSKEGLITLKHINEIKVNQQKAAFQPILDALKFIPLSFNYDSNNIVLVEGIYDFYCYSLFNLDKKLKFFPCVNADSIIHHIPYMIFLSKNYYALWDNDNEGRKKFEKAKKIFGAKEKENLFLIPLKGRMKNRKLEHLFEKGDLLVIKNELELPSNASFEKTILSLYYSNKKKSIQKKLSASTHSNFNEVMSFFN